MYWVVNLKGRVPLTPKSDQCLISPHSNTARSNIKVVRKEEVIKK